MSQDQARQMPLAREYIRRADGLWRRHKTRAVAFTVLALACLAGWLAKQAAAWTLRHIRTTAGRDA